jgi:GntR family transcriptional regulator
LGTGIPIYYRIANHLRNRIMNGIYELGEKIPSESMLCDEFNTSRITIRQALKVLEDQGMIIRKQGVGSLVNKKVRLHPVNFNGYIEEIIFQLLPAKVINCDKVEIEPEQDIRELLRVPEDQRTVIKFERTRAIEGELTSYAENYLPVYIGREIDEEDLEEHSLVDLMDQKEITVKEATQNIQATSANKTVAQKLDIKIGDPILFSEYLMTDNNNHFVNLARVYYHADRYKYTVKMERLNDPN